jgi:hypothetical protein
MFYDLDDYCRVLFSKTPAVGLVAWRNDAGIASFVARLGPALRKVVAKTTLARLDASALDGDGFTKRLHRCLSKAGGESRCLLVVGIEPLISAAGRALNGYREAMRSLRGLVIAVREDRQSDFLRSCPDLASWIGAIGMAKAEDLSPPLTLRDINTSLRKLERKFGMTTKAFLEKQAIGAIAPFEESWLWNELVSIRSGIRKEAER